VDRLAASRHLGGVPVKHIRIPGVVDAVIEDDPSSIRSAANDADLDRAFTDRSPVVNAAFLRVLRQTLQFGGQPLPAVAPRAAAGRADAQDELWARLTALAPDLATGPDELEGLAAVVSGRRPVEDAGVLVQQTVGRLFSPSFRATPESWKAALLVDKAARTLNPVTRARWALDRRVERAKRLLAGMVDGDLAALQGIAVALHHIVEGIEHMRTLYLDALTRKTLTPEEAAKQCLFAPTVVRQPVAGAAKPGVRRGAVIALNLQAAQVAANDGDLVFLRNAWSRCPAESWVPALLGGVWRRATES
jgi:hypothetical protein